MSYSVEQLLDRGVSLKRSGNLEAARDCYISALEVDPTNMMTYISLGKTAYLLGQQDLSVKCYLASTHLQISPVERAIIENKLPLHLKFQYDSFPPEVLNSLPKKSAFIIFIDGNTPRHLAHSLADLSGAVLEQNPSLSIYGEIYHSHIFGDGSYERILQKHRMSTSNQMRQDEEFYIPWGRKF